MKNITKETFRKIIATFLCVMSFVYLFSVTFCAVPEANMDNSKIILGFVLGSTLGVIVGFYFGDSEAK